MKDRYRSTRWKKFGNKKRLIIAMGFLAAAGAVTLGTMAFSSAVSNGKENPFYPMTVTDINIKEENGTQYVMDASGTVTTKKVVIENPDGNAKKPVFVRVAVVPSAKDKQGGYLNKEVAVSASTVFDQSWTADGGYYYYKYAVMPGSATTELFKNSTVKLDCTLQDGEYAQVDIIADTVQAAANGTDQTTITTKFAKDAWGYDNFTSEEKP